MIATQSVLRALDILGCFPPDRPVQGVAEISRAIGLHKATTHRLLATLEMAGFVEHCDGGKYRLGLRLFELGSLVASQLNLRTAAQPVVADLCARTGETVHLAILSDGAAVIVEKADGPQHLRMFSFVGARLPAHASSLGKILLAFLPPPELEAALAGLTLAPLTERTMTDRKGLREHLGEVRRLGYARNLEEMELGLQCMAAPVRDATGAVAAALSITVPSARMNPERAADLIASVRAAADRLSHRLGFMARPTVTPAEPVTAGTIPVRGANGDRTTRS